MSEQQIKVYTTPTDQLLGLACVPLEFLSLYHGNRRVDLSEAAGLLAALED